MDLFAIFDATPAELIDFASWGIMLNVISGALVTFFIMIRAVQMDERDQEQLLKFSAARREFIREHCSGIRQFTNYFLWLIPLHTLILNVVYMYNMFRTPGLYGILKGLIESEKLSFVPLMNLKIVSIEELTNDK